MSKPLHLTIYPLQEKVGRFAQRGYLVGKRAIETWEIPYLSRDKRLTEPELAADYWAMIAHFNKVQWAEMASGEPVKESTWDTLAHRNAAMYRFATHPHYFEATEPESDTE